MANYVVIDHRLDGDVYRLTVGEAIEQEVPKVDENGAIVRNGDGAQVLETTTVVVGAVDFVFAADDPKYEDKSEEEIAQIQRGAALEQLELARMKREEDEQARAAQTRLPGIGDPL